MKLKKLLALPVLILILAACGTSSKLALKLNYEKGKKYYYTSVSEQTVDQTVMGQAMKTKSTTTTGYIWEVKDVDKDGNFLVTITYDKIETKTEGGKGENNKGQEFLKGVTFDMVVTPKGKVKEMHGIDKLMDKAMTAYIPDSLKDDPATQATMGPVKEMLKKQFNDKTMSSMMEQMTNYFPEKDVEVGDTWENTVDNTAIIPMKIVSTYKVADISNGIAKLEIDSKISPGNGEGMMGMKMDINGTQKGTMEIDTKTGIIVKSNVEQTMDGNMSMMGMSFPMKISGKSTVEAKEMK